MLAAVAVVAAAACASPAEGAVAGPGPLPRIVVERPFARHAGLAAGDTVLVGTTPSRADAGRFVVAGVYDPPPDPSRLTRTSARALVSLPDLEALAGRRDRVSRIVLAVAPGADPDSLVAALDADPLGYRAWSARDVARRSSQTFVVISRFHRAISWLSILAGTVFLAAIVLLQVQELRRTLGVLRVIGVSRVHIFRIIVGETVLLAIIGAAIGVGVAFAVSAAVNRYYQGYFDTNLVFSTITPAHVALAFAVAAVVGVVVGALATAYLFRLEIHEVLGR